MKLVHASVLLFCATLLLLAATGVSAGTRLDKLVKNKRDGKLVWGEFYDVPKVNGARAWAYTEVSHKDGKPIAAGVKLTKQMLDNANKIPCVKPPGKPVKGLEKSCESTMMMDFPKGSPFKLMLLNFGTQGHPPVGIYNFPHFDIHFYLQSKKWLNTNLGPSAMGKCNGFSPRAWYLLNRPIPAQCFPKGFANLGSTVPMMGNHMINPKAKEFTTPGSFNETFLYGSHGGKIVFYEPMITLKTFLAKKALCAPIPSLPAEVHDAGWYPKTYCFYSHSNGDTFIELRNYTWKKAGCKRPAKAYDGYLLADPKTVPTGCPYVKPPPMPKAKAAAKP